MTSDPILRASLVTASAVVMVIGTLAGFGLLGTRVEESSGGALSSQATLVAPATTAFSIWSLIYLGLIAYVVWQWWARGNARAARISWLAALSMLLNAAWLGVTQVGLLWLSVVVILTLAVVLGLLVQRLGQSPPASRVEAVVVDGTFGVYLGWVSVATVANITAVLVDAGVDPGGIWSEALAVLVLAVAALLGAVYAFRLDGRWAIAAAMTWAVGWIAAGRLGGPLYSTATAVAAIAAGIAILAPPAYARSRRTARPADIAPLATTSAGRG